jgi:hypothetical protein
LLLGDPRVDPSADDQLAFRYAALNGHDKVIALLLKDRRVDPGAKAQNAIQWAARNGKGRVVELLLNDDRVDPGAYDQYALQWAVKNGHHNVVRLLLGHPRVDPSAQNQCAIREAASRGYSKVVEVLCHDPRVDPSTGDQYAIRQAARNGHVQVILVLLHDPRVVKPIFNRLSISVSSRVHKCVFEVLPWALLIACSEGDLAAIQRFDVKLRTLTPQYLDVLISRARNHSQTFSYFRDCQRAVLDADLRRTQQEILHVPIERLVDPMNKHLWCTLKNTFLLEMDDGDAGKTFRAWRDLQLNNGVSTTCLALNAKLLLSELVCLPEVLARIVAMFDQI